MTELGTNPKDLVGAKKVPHHLVPKVAVSILARVMELGASKYGPYNWRENKVQSMTYVDAMRRHLDLFELSETIDQESEEHHLGHVMACAAILLDATYSGNLIDNRPPRNESLLLAMHALNGARDE